MDEQIETKNPFSAPQSDTPAAIAGQDVSATNTLGQIAKRVFLDWEKMRLAYNGILVAFSLLIGWRQMGSLDFWVVAVLGAIGSNLCYFLGPVFDTYITWLGYRSLGIRWAVFALGTLFTMAGAALAILSIGQWQNL